MENISKLMTEQSNVRSNNIETQSVKDILMYMNDENQMITNAIEKMQLLKVSREGVDLSISELVLRED